MGVKNCRLDYEFVKNYFEQQCCCLLEDNYVNNRTLMNYRCICGNISMITYDNFKRGKRCTECKKSKLNKAFKTDIVLIREVFDSYGCELLTDSYENAKQILCYRCSCGEISKVRLNDFKKSPRCPLCSLKFRSGSNHHNWNTNREHVMLNKKLHWKSHKLLRRTLENLDLKKSDVKSSMLGFSTKQLSEHLQKSQQWNDVKDMDWEIDHIFPIKAFIENGITDIKLINCLDNLQPLTKNQNMKKGGRYDKHEFKNWLNDHGVVMEVAKESEKKVISCSL